MIEEKYMKQLKKLEDELFPRLSLAKLKKEGITEAQFINESLMCPNLKDCKILIPFKNGKKLDYLDMTSASGTKIKYKKKGKILKVHLNAKLLTETYKWIEKCFNNESLYEPVLFVPFTKLAITQYSGECLMGYTAVFYPIDSEGLGYRVKEFDWWTEEQNQPKNFSLREIVFSRILHEVKK